MSRPLDFNIRERLAAYLAGEITLHDFEDWFYAETWDVDQKGDIALAGLVYSIKLRLAEFSNGDWTNDELRSLLKSILEKHVMITSQPQQVQILYGTSNLSSRITASVTYPGL